MNEWKKWPIKEIGKNEKNFPKELKRLKPELKKLYFRGNWNNDLFIKVIAVVGSRRMTRYGREMTSRFIPDFVSKNVTVVSGFMYGVDSYAHEECLKYGGKTIAVTGFGLNCLYPPENDSLYTSILESGGLVISEFEPDFQAKLWSFPVRNKTVAALANKGVLIIEAGANSGSLITAKLADNLKRSVYAVPGMATCATSEGTNSLIGQGKAKLVTCYEDIFPSMGDKIQSKLFAREFSSEEAKIINELKRESMSADELSEIMMLPIQKISENLSKLLISGDVDEENGRYFIKRRQL
ncbi:MAG TPA: DNA-processing protein DprA [Patescibacteria group bacterium]